MASRTRGRRGNSEERKQCINCVVAAFQVLVACQSITYISGQGYMYPASSRSHKLLEGVDLFPRQQGLGVTSGSQDKKLYTVSHTTSPIRTIRFEPPFLDFDSESIGMPKLKTVYIHNPSKVQDLQLSSISARTSHFHSSFFEKKVVPPGGNTSFEVVFLARVIGNVENTLFINTLHGTFSYQVFGIGIPNPYKLRPYLGAKVPLNSTFSPLISMHNPTNHPLQITELYSSSGYLQLQLPQGQHQAHKDVWEIAPYETKDVIRARFLGQVEAKHTAFIRIKTSHKDIDGFHILPVEVEVSSAPGIYSSTEMLDFGTLRTQYDMSETLPLFLLNSGDHEVIISDVTLLYPNPAVSIHFRPVKLMPSEATFTLIANVTYSASFAKTDADQRGILIVTTEEKTYAKVEIPYIVDILNGTLGYDEKSVLFNVGKDVNAERILREVSLSNSFSFPVILQEVFLASNRSSMFKVVDFTGPLILPPSEGVVAFSVEFSHRAAGFHTHEYGTGSLHYLTLKTNASKFSLPLHIYSGIITYEVLRGDNKKIDFGLMGTLDKRQVLLALYNHNPTRIVLEEINSTLPNLEVQLVSLEGYGRNLTAKPEFQMQNFDLPCNSCAVFEVSLNSSARAEEIVGSLNVFTQYQDVRVPISARVVVGTLTVTPEKVKFPQSFPGLVVHQPLTITNTFAQSTKLESVRFNSGDKRFYYKKIKNQGLILHPNKKAKVGRVYFDARQTCKPDRCYVGLPTSTTIGHHWLTTLALGLDSVEFDTKRYKELRRRWKTLQARTLTGPNTTLVLNTDLVQEVEVALQASLYWPTLLEERSFDFPLTHVGRKSVAALVVFNPADVPVIVQVLPLSLYPHPASAMDILGYLGSIEDESFMKSNATVFHLLDPRQDTGKNPQMVWLEYTLNGRLNHSVVNIFLDPGQKMTLKVEFVPYDDLPKSTLILLRNNLTILDSVVMHGSGVYEHLTLGGKVANRPHSILRFKLTRDILKDCTKKKRSPSFTVRKWFHANNTGLLPIHITSVSVSGSSCEGYGFRILDCDQFILPPNSSKKLEIAFTPDFTSYLVVHQLKLVTAQGNEMVFLLNVTLPPQMLPLCRSTIPRPSWEPALYYFIALVMLVLFFGVLLMAYLEAINIWEPWIRLYEIELKTKQDAGLHRTARKEALESFGHRFDLRNVATSFMTTPNTSIRASRKSNSMMEKNAVTVDTSSGSHTQNRVVKFGISQGTKADPELSMLPNSHHMHHAQNLSRFLTSGTKVMQDVGEKRTVNTFMQSTGFSVLSTNMKPETDANNKKHSDYKEIYSLIPDASSVVTKVPPEFTGGIKDCAQLPVNRERRDSSPENFHNVLIRKSEKIFSAPAGDIKSTEGVVSKVSEMERDAIRVAAKEKRNAHSDSNRNNRSSTSSSTGADLPDLESDKVMKEIILITATNSATTESEQKRARGKKLRKMKLSRRQIRATQAKEAAVEEAKPVASEEQDGKAKESTLAIGGSLEAIHHAVSSHKNLRQASFGKTCGKKEQKASTAEESMRRSSQDPRPVGDAPSKAGSKRRSNSCNNDAERHRVKLLNSKQVTIYKNHPPFSRSSSSQDASESSSSEGVALWDTPSRHGDADADLRQISTQTRNADLVLSDNKQQKEMKRAKEAASPVRLTSSSRSSSYSSVLSTASSNEGNPGRHSNGLHSGHKTPSKKLARSCSDTTGAMFTVPQLRKRAPYPPVTFETSTPSPSQSPCSPQKNVARHGAEHSSPKDANVLVAPTLTGSSPSMMAGREDCTRAGDRTGTVGMCQSQLFSQPTLNYTAFGQPSFNFMETLMGIGTTTNQGCWSSPFSESSSLFSSPSPQNSFDAAEVPCHANWSSSGSPLPSATYGVSDVPCTSTTSRLDLVRNSLGWGEVPTLTSVTNTTTHSIWSVSNAVTMDENRDTADSDPLGLKDIWANSRSTKNQEWNSRR